MPDYCRQAGFTVLIIPGPDRRGRFLRAFSIERWLVAIHTRFVHTKVAVREAFGIADALDNQRGHGLAGDFGALQGFGALAPTESRGYSSQNCLQDMHIVGNVQLVGDG